MPVIPVPSVEGSLCSAKGVLFSRCLKYEERPFIVSDVILSSGNIRIVPTGETKLDRRADGRWLSFLVPVRGLQPLGCKPAPHQALPQNRGRAATWSRAGRCEPPTVTNSGCSRE